jgi:two-component system, chemotaxis family, chemotaxis protein CheY
MNHIEDVRILVVEDCKVTRVLMRDLLYNFGFENVTWASDGEEALKILGHQRISLILSDWNMLPMNGYDFLCAVRKKDKKIPFIMVTAENRQEFFDKALEAGVSNYIVKPFNAGIVKKKIMATLAVKL